MRHNTATNSNNAIWAQVASFYSMVIAFVLVAVISGTKIEASVFYFLMVLCIPFFIACLAVVGILFVAAIEVIKTPFLWGWGKTVCRRGHHLIASHGWEWTGLSSGMQFYVMSMLWTKARKESACFPEENRCVACHER